MTGASDRLQLRSGSTVAVIGGGPAGSSCACRLKREALRRGMDLRVVVFEGKYFLDQHNQCVGVVSPPLEDTIRESLGIELPYEIIRRRIFAYELHGGKEEIFLIGEEKEGPTYTVQRAAFDRFMLEAARAQGVEVIHGRVTHFEFLHDSSVDEVRVYAENSYLRADAVVGAFGLDCSMLNVFETATRGIGDYRRPLTSMQTIITKIETPPGFIEKKIGNVVSAFLFPAAIPQVEFGAVSPKSGYVVVNIAGIGITSRHMDEFLALPAVRAHLPDFDKGSLSYFAGKFPTSPGKGNFGRRYIIAGDATGWLRAFKGKGINTAVITGVRAADALLYCGLAKESLASYAGLCTELRRDHLFGVLVRTASRVASRLGVMDRIIETAKTDPCLYNALYDAVSGSETYRKILLDMIRNKPFRRFWRIAFGSPVRNGKSEPGDRSAMDIKIRTITVHDVQAILRINEKTMGKKLEAYWEGKVANQIQCDPLCNLVAEVDGEVVGFVMGDTRGWEFNMPLSGWIEMMGVEPAYQGKGVGRRLLESLFAYFAGRGIESVHALISWDDSDLVDYFRSMDFKRGEFIHLQKNLSPNPQSQQGGQKS